MAAATVTRPSTEAASVDLKKNLFTVMKEWAQQKDCMKVIKYTIEWFSRFTAVPTSVKSLGAFAGDVKNMMSVVKVPTGLSESWSSLRAYIKMRKEGVSSQDLAFAGRDVVRKTSSVINDICDGGKLGTRFFNYKTKGLDGFSAACTLGGSVSNLTDDIARIRSDKKSPTTQHKILNALGACASVAYTVVGSLGLYAFATGVGSVLMLPALTAAVIFTTTQFFYKNLVDPEQKNRDPHKVAREYDRLVVSQRGTVQVATS